jgi:tetratricopeptide (TPR) repeat protein
MLLQRNGELSRSIEFESRMGMRTLATFLLISTLTAGQASPNVATVLQQGAKLVSADQLAEAQDLYEKALRSSPDDPDLRFALGMVFLRQHNWFKAAENYRSSLSSRPGMIKPLFYLAEAYFMESDLDHARETIAQAARLAPNDAQVCQKYGEYLGATIETRKEGLSWLEKARRLQPGLVRIDFEIGKAQFELTDFASATSSFEAALKKDAGDGEAAYFLAESWARLSDWQKARDSYTYALAHGYEKGPAYYGLGRARVELGEFEGAVRPLQRAKAIQPSLVNAHFQLGKAYRQLGRTREAQVENRLFSAMTDRVDTSSGVMGSDEEQAWKRVKPMLEANKEQEALELLAQLPIADGSSGGESHYLLGVMYYSMRRTNDAKRVLATARSNDPQSARTAAYLGIVELSDGDTAAAENSFQAALALNSGETLALIGMGGIRYQQQRWADVIMYLEKSRTADPDTLFLLCDSYYRAGKPDEALLTAEVIRAFGADRKPLLEKLETLVSLHQTDRPHALP